MINKRIFCAFIAALLIFSLQLQTLAAVNITLDMDKTGFINDIVTVEGTASARTRITMLIIKPGFTLSSLNEDNMKDRIVSMKQNSNISADRSFTFTFNMKDEYPSGTYTIVVSGADVTTPQTKTFYFVNMALRQTGLDKINNASSGKDIMDNILYDFDSKAIFEMIGFSYTDYELAVNKEFICNKLFAARPYTAGAAGEQKAVSTFNQNTYLTIINEAAQSQKQEKFELYANKLEIQIEKGSLYNYLSETGKLNIAWDTLKIMNFSDVKALQDDFFETMVLTLIKECPYGVIGEALPLMSDYLGILLTGGYASLNDDQKTEVHKALVGLNDISKTRTAFNDAVIKAGNPDSNNNNNNGGQNSGGPVGSGGNRGNTTIGAYGGSIEEYRPVSEPAPDREPIDFNDVPDSHWAKESIKYLSGKNVINGMGDGSFMPDDYITREQFITIVVKAFGIEGANDSPVFNDVSEDAWYASFVASASGAGIINGIGDDAFGIGMNIIRQDMSVILERACKVKGIDMPEIKDEPTFVDFDNVSDYAASSITLLYKAGILNGSDQNEVMPLAPSTRAQVSKVVYEVLKLINK